MQIHKHTCTHTKPDRSLIAVDTVCIWANLASVGGLIKSLTGFDPKPTNHRQSHTTQPLSSNYVCGIDNHRLRRCVRSSRQCRCSWSLLGLQHRWLRSHTGTTNMRAPLMRGEERDGGRAVKTGGEDKDTTNKTNSFQHCNKEDVSARLVPWQYTCVCLF